MATYVPAKKNTAWIGYVSLVSQSSTLVMQSNPTIASGDFKVSIDGGALANLATLPTVTPASGKMVKISLSSSEMNGDNITVVCSDAAGAEWCDLVFNIQTAARQIDDLAFPATSGRSVVVDAAGLVDATAVKVGPTGSGTAQTARDLGQGIPNAVPGAAGGLLIAGSNAATTFAGLTTGALSCTTITASGAVAFQSTFAVTTSTSLAAISCTTLTASGAVAFQSTFAVTTSTSLAAISGSTLTLSGAVAFQSTLTVTGAVLFSSTFATTGTTTFNAFTVTNNMLVSGNSTVTGTTTHTGAFTATNASNSIKGIAVTATGLDLVAASSTFSQALTDAVWDEVLSGHVTAGSAGAYLGTMGTDYAGATFIVGNVIGSVQGNVDGSVASVAGDVAGKVLGGGAGTITGTGVRSDLRLIAGQTVTCAAGVTVLASVGTAATSTAQTGDVYPLVDTEVAAIKAKTDNLPAAPAAVGDIPTAVQNADALIGRNVAGGSSTGRTVKQALAVLRNKKAIVGTTASYYDVDDSTVLFTSALTTDATADPITAEDPT